MGLKRVLLALGAVAICNASSDALLNQRSRVQGSHGRFGRSLMGKGDEEVCEGEPNAYVQGKMATVNGAPPSVIGVGSCWKPGKESEDAIRILVDDIKPDLQLWLGDNIYGDTTDMNEMRNKYNAKKNSCQFRKFMQSNIPIMATWDDHDYGDDGEWDSYPRKVESQQLFVEHFDIPESDPRHASTGPKRKGVYASELLGSKEQGRIHVIMLDNRYHHSPTFEKGGDDCAAVPTMLGADQWSWLENELENTESELVIIGSGLQILPPVYRANKGSNTGWSSYLPRQYCSWVGDGSSFLAALESLGESDITDGNRFTERWSEIPQDRERLLRLIQKAVNTGKTKEVVLTSGDVHFGEIMEMQIPATANYEAVKVREITASGFSQDGSQHRQGHPHRISVVADVNSNFGSIEVDWETSTIRFAIHTDTITDRAVYTFQTFKPFGVAPKKQLNVGGAATAIGVGVSFVGLGVALAMRRQKLNRLSPTEKSLDVVPKKSENEMESGNPIFDETK